MNPAAIGWSRRPLHRANLRGHSGRKKRWDYWCVTSETHLLAIVYADVDYLGLAGVYFLDFRTQRVVERTVVVPGARGFWQPETVAGGDIAFEGFGLSLAITEERGGTRLLVDLRGFLGSKLSADVLVSKPADHETLGVVIPWSDQRFQYTSKHNTLPARGKVNTLGASYGFEEDNQSYGCLDFGRGVWPYRCVWNWASASGRQGKDVLGLQLGGQWTRGTGFTENALCINGRLHKLGEELDMLYDRADFMKPWRIRAPLSHRVDVTFTPFFQRQNRIELGVMRSELHQMFGKFSGVVVADDGTRIEVRDLMGWAEEHDARW